jgi:ATP-dependent helicase HrpB
LLGINKYSDFIQLPLNEIIKSLIPWELSTTLDNLAPEKTEVPSGSHIKINYFEDGKTPEIEVRLQELFGWLETPTINQGRTKLLIHLLSPGYKPVQVTQDLHSFWSKTYFEVKKELMRRYPKHSWPENPLTAKAVRGVKRG